MNNQELLIRETYKDNKEDRKLTRQYFINKTGIFVTEEYFEEIYNNYEALISSDVLITVDDYIKSVEENLHVMTIELPNQLKIVSKDYEPYVYGEIENYDVIEYPTLYEYLDYLDAKFVEYYEISNRLTKKREDLLVTCTKMTELAIETLIKYIKMSDEPCEDEKRQLEMCGMVLDIFEMMNKN